jgi:hypothetical protein
MEIKLPFIPDKIIVTNGTKVVLWAEKSMKDKVKLTKEDVQEILTAYYKGFA